MPEQILECKDLHLLIHGSAFLSDAFQTPDILRKITVFQAICHNPYIHRLAAFRAMQKAA
jgi:hypothetical protein